MFAPVLFHRLHNIGNLVINIGNSVINIGSSVMNGVRRAIAGFSFFAEQMLLAVNPPRLPKQISRCLRAEQKTLSRRQICLLHSFFFFILFFQDSNCLPSSNISCLFAH
jgi:hypothetical protein